MRTVVILLVPAMILVACISSPEFHTLDESPEAGGAGSSPIAVTDPDAADPSATPADDAASVPDDDAEVDGGDTTPPEPPPPPPTNTCNTTGAPAGALCCGAGNTPPLCVGLACAHCSDCVAKACAAQTVCCAISPGKSGKYQGMTCAANGFAGYCP